MSACSTQFAFGLTCSSSNVPSFIDIFCIFVLFASIYQFYSNLGKSWVFRKNNLTPNKIIRWCIHFSILEVKALGYCLECFSFCRKRFRIWTASQKICSSKLYMTLGILVRNSLCIHTGCLKYAILKGTHQCKFCVCVCMLSPLV